MTVEQFICHAMNRVLKRLLTLLKSLIIKFKQKRPDWKMFKRLLQAITRAHEDDRLSEASIENAIDVKVLCVIWRK